VEITDYFSATYNDARTKILEAANEAGAQIDSIKHPQNGPDAESIFTNVALIGSTAVKNVVVLGSGTHALRVLPGLGFKQDFYDAN